MHCGIEWKPSLSSRFKLYCQTKRLCTRQPSPPHLRHTVHAVAFTLDDIAADVHSICTQRHSRILSAVKLHLFPLSTPLFNCILTSSYKFSKVEHTAGTTEVMGNSDRETLS